MPTSSDDMASLANTHAKLELDGQIRYGSRSFFWQKLHAHEQRIQLLNLCMEKAKASGYSELIVTTEDDNPAVRASCHAAGFPDTGLMSVNGETRDLLRPAQGQNLGSGLYMTQKLIQE